MNLDNYIIPFGKFRFTALCRVPPNYLLGLYGAKNMMKKYPEINEYIETNMELLVQRQQGFIPPPFDFPCQKITYANESDAKKVLSIIRDNDQKHKKPIRAYECEKCGGWHLTSKEFFGKENKNS